VQSTIDRRSAETDQSSSRLLAGAALLKGMGSYYSFAPNSNNAGVAAASSAGGP